jgi:hypothetical protein
MIIAVSGIRDLAVESEADVELAVADAIFNVEEMRFGGARGSDTVALGAACELADAELLLRVFVPGRLRDQPREAVAAAQCADEVVELGLPLTPWAYYQRNDALLRGADRLLAFTDGRDTGGTAYTIERAAEWGIPTDLIPVRAAAKPPRGRRPAMRATRSK